MEVITKCVLMMNTALSVLEVCRLDTFLDKISVKFSGTSLYAEREVENNYYQLANSKVLGKIFIL